MRKFFLISGLALAVALIDLLHAQTPPVMMQAANSAPAAQVTPAPKPSASTDTTQTMQLLQEMQAANAETLKKQTATLQALDDLQKAASEIRIYTKRS